MEALSYLLIVLFMAALVRWVIRKDRAEDAKEKIPPDLTKERGTMYYISTCTVYFNGDPSVGLGSYSYELQVPHDLNTLDREELEAVRIRIKELYGYMDAEFRPYMVVFDFETF